jgi:S1-C subfamily serine protease
MGDHIASPIGDDRPMSMLGPRKTPKLGDKHRGRLRVTVLLTLALVLAVTFVAITGCSGGSSVASTTTNVGATTIATSGPRSTSTLPADRTRQGLASPGGAVAARVLASVVSVKVTGVAPGRHFRNQPYEGVGSGIIYSSDGYILTNNHVVSQNGTPAQTVEVTFGSGQPVAADIVATDATHDLAVIKVKKTGLAPVEFAPSAHVRVGDWAIAIGSPSDYENSVTLGIVSGLGRQLDTGDPTMATLTGLVQTDAAISPGNSGGGLFDAQGRVIGMPEAYLPPSQTGAENVGFAIPADTVVAVAKKLMGK